MHVIKLVKIPKPLIGCAGMPAFENLADLQQFVELCQACGLRQQAERVVFGEGVARSRIVFCGEGPGADEDRLGRPFVGRAGQLLDQMMEAMGFSRAVNAYILNVVKCRPPNNRTPTMEERDTCRPHLEAQLGLIRPVIIVLLGSSAIKTFLGEDARVSRCRGRWQCLPSGIWAMPTYHPAALLRNPGWKVEAWDDLKKVIDQYRALVDPSHVAPAHPLSSAAGVPKK